MHKRKQLKEAEEPFNPHRRDEPPRREDQIRRGEDELGQRVTSPELEDLDLEDLGPIEPFKRRKVVPPNER